MITAVMPTYGRKDVVFERGEGSYLYAADGRRYVDFTSGIAVNALGHCHPYLVKALIEQGQKLWHTSNLFRIGNGEKLAKRLTEVSFADTMFFCNSGAEAIEGGIKLIRKYQFMNGQPKRYKIICFQAAFLTTLLVAWLIEYDPPENASAWPTSLMCCSELASRVAFATFEKSHVRVSAVSLFLMTITCCPSWPCATCWPRPRGAGSRRASPRSTRACSATARSTSSRCA